MSAEWSAADWLEQFRLLGGAWRRDGEAVQFSWPADGNEALIREHWRAIENDEERRSQVRRLVQ